MEDNRAVDCRGCVHEENSYCLLKCEECLTAGKNCENRELRKDYDPTKETIHNV